MGHSVWLSLGVMGSRLMGYLYSCQVLYGFQTVGHSV